jgi:iron-sulfur cluster assembly accessory protein
MNFTLTSAAERFIRLMLRADGGPQSGFRLSVTPGGCAGLSAEIDVTDTPRPGDTVVETNGFKLFLPIEARLLLDGVIIDFVDSAAQTGLVFRHPNGFSCASSAARAAH